MRNLLQAFAEALFRVLFTFECRGQENVPEQGPAIVAANHPSYLDPVLLSLEIPRPIHFMAWDALFRIPLLGILLRIFGAFPVDIGRGRGREAYERAKLLVESGEVVGIFPEGGRSSAGWLEPTLRAGAARLAYQTGARIVPATIAGAHRAWPRWARLPVPARIKVRFHEAIDPAPFQAMSEEEAVPLLLAELRKRVERSLLPGVKAELRTDVIYTLPSPWPRLYEAMPPMLLALLVFWKTRAIMSVMPAYGYIAYLLLDHFVIPQGRLIKWIRNSSPVTFLFGWSATVLGVLGLPRVLAQGSLVAVVGGALFPYLYEHGRRAIDFIRGIVFTTLLEMGALKLAPAAAGPHVALSLYAAAYAWERRTVFWRYSTLVLLFYAVACCRLLGFDGSIVPHVIAGLVGWMAVRAIPLRSEESEPEEKKSLEGLGLRD